MILLPELFERLAYGVLQNTSLVDEATGLVIEERKLKVVSAINTSLTRLHSRFVLREANLIVEMQSGRTRYPLLKKYAVQSHVPTEILCPYIMDMAGAPFDDDVIKVLDVYDSYGVHRSLNNKDDDWTIYTPRPTMIQNPRPRCGEVLNLAYQQNHPRVSPAGNQEIDIPDSLDLALDAFIAYSCFAGINTQDAKATAADMLGLYSSVCEEVIANDLVNSSKSNTGVRFKNNGWV
ncbi:virion structural protein [Achromobacter phage JWAlpha]|uniref:Uncharacterized protein n=1 Tax=Achromobacter phage JWAlpha TaxID=1416009 RepID=V9VG44_9CAUD|nr:virion structural protein [Achromobacter phage JWAlpha]AHC94036.1 hypothetical protein JJJB_0083 [Achromobacter phage JWAlpha]